MKMLDLLLKSNTENFVRPTQKLHIKELDKAIGGKAIIEIKAVTLDKIEHIRTVNESSADIKIMTIIEGVTDPDLKDPALREKFNVATPADLLKKILLSGTIEDIYLKISKLSGYSRDTVEEIKNS